MSTVRVIVSVSLCVGVGGRWVGGGDEMEHNLNETKYTVSWALKGSPGHLRESPGHLGGCLASEDIRWAS